LERGEPGSNFRRLAFAFGCEPLPDCPFLGLPRQSLLNAFAGAGVMFGFALRTADGILAFGDTPAKILDLFSQRSRRIDGLGRRDKRPRLEIALFAIGAVKPDPKLARKFQRRQCIRVIAPGLVRRPVARFAKGVEHISDLLRDDALIGQAAKRLLKCFALAQIKGVMGCNRPGQKLGELAQLENRRAGIVAEISLRQRPQLHQLGSVHS
jgi:alkanesulfonate monooxygenase SsuD/methylene tetrahydromethanopterin reductase-like flavin-dependent oxidoreductase (luciferase family)